MHWKGLVSLKESVCTHDEDDLSGLLTSLRDGSFSRDGKKHTTADVEVLRHSKRWKERCDPCLKQNQTRASHCARDGTVDCHA
jgi:hypothetical protein